MFVVPAGIAGTHDCMDAGGRATQEQLPRSQGWHVGQPRPCDLDTGNPCRYDEYGLNSSVSFQPVFLPGTGGFIGNSGFHQA